MSGEHTEARTFPAFAARRGGRPGTFWGLAWSEAVEDTVLDPEPLRRGRAHARSGRLGPVTVSAGHVVTHVREGGAVHRAMATVEVLDEAAWERLWETVAARPAEAEALLAGALPPELLDAAEDARVRLLPAYGDLDTDCDCGAYEQPCPHAAALCHQVSWLLDEDPALLLLLRGRDTRRAAEELKSAVLLRALAGDGEDGEDDDEEDGAGAAGAGDGSPAAGGDPADDAYARPPVPLPPLPPLPGGPAPDTEADPLDRLVADAAARAGELLGYLHGRAAAPRPPLERWPDLVRIAATHPDPRVAARLREACGDPDLLDRAAGAWRLAGRAGLAALEEEWTPPRHELARARTALLADWDDLPEPRISGNRLTLPGRDIQLRYGRDACWYPFRRAGRAWHLAAPGHPDPSTALAELLGS
ncbi:hypothetical protein GCM10027168_50330 [Streptomyces capparidis]